MGNGEGGKKPILYLTEISHSPYDILRELNEKTGSGLPHDRKAPMRITELFDSAEN